MLMEELNNKSNAINYLNATDFIRVILYGVKSFFIRGDTNMTSTLSEMGRVRQK